MNITLIGMPAVGKSVVGKAIAKRLKYNFIDGDDMIESAQNKKLQEIIDKFGEERFLEIERDTLLTLKEKNLKNTILSPGGSVIYIPELMAFLKEISIVIYLETDYPGLKKRMPNYDSRGIVGAKNKTLKQLYEERASLYKKYADFSVKVPDKIDTKRIVEEILMKTI